jgi:outer membrane protein OmpA-like peptidoglycan-associated protein
VTPLPASPPVLPKRQVLSNLQKALVDDKDIAIDEVTRGIRLTIWNIHFINGTDEILHADYPRLETIANAIRQVPVNRNIQVEGHVAAEGRPEEEMDLSFWRGQRILEALSSRGIADERIYFRPWGGLQPLASNATEEGRRWNNRAEIIILNEGED